MKRSKSAEANKVLQVEGTTMFKVDMSKVVIVRQWEGSDVTEEVCVTFMIV